MASLMNRVANVVRVLPRSRVRPAPTLVTSSSWTFGQHIRIIHIAVLVGVELPICRFLDDLWINLTLCPTPNLQKHLLTSPRSPRSVHQPWDQLGLRVPG